MARRGTLVLVVGPSGAGKDTLLSIARDRLRGDDRFAFPRRVITRPSGEGEDHDTADDREFARARDRGAFALDWSAHGLRYGIPKGIADDLQRGRTVAVNVSRTVVAEAAMQYAPVLVCQILASPEVLEQRLKQRSRSSDGDVDARLQRPANPLPASLPVSVITNDGTPDEAAAKFFAVLLLTQNESSRCLPLSTGVQ